MPLFIAFLAPAALYALIYAGYSLRMGRPLSAVGSLLSGLVPLALIALLLWR